MKKKIIISISIIISMLLILIIFIYPYFKKINVNVTWKSKEQNTSEKLVYDFINTALTKEDIGIYTNYLNNEVDGDITKGHYVLSESEGLMMLYAVNSGNKDLFDKNYNIVKNKMKLDNGLISWRVNENEKSEASATIDELRIVKALIFAYDRWGDFKYKFNAIRISNALLKNSTLDGNLIDFTQPDGKSETITLCYLDLVTMSILSNINSKWSKVYNESIEIIDNGLISKEVPLYKKSYSFESNTYNSEKNVDLLLSLIVILNRIEDGQSQEASVKWIEDKFYHYGYLVSTYDSKTGEETSKIESPSIYAITALIAKAINNEKLFNKAIEKLDYYQIKDDTSKLYGGFGNEQTLDVYSFDNLNALLAFQKK